MTKFTAIQKERGKDETLFTITTKCGYWTIQWTKIDGCLSGLISVSNKDSQHVRDDILFPQNELAKKYRQLTKEGVRDAVREAKEWIKKQR